MIDDVIGMLARTINESDLGYRSVVQDSYVVIICKSDNRYIGRIGIVKDRISVIWRDYDITLVEYTDDKFLKLVRECADNKKRIDAIFFAELNGSCTQDDMALVGGRYW